MGPLVKPMSYPFQLLGFSLFLAWEILIAPFEQAFTTASDASLALQNEIYSLITAGLLVAAACIGRSGKRDLWTTKTVDVCTACALVTPVLILAGSALPGASTALSFAARLPKAGADAGFFLMWSSQLASHKAYVSWTAYASSFVIVVAVFFGAAALGHVALAAMMFILPVGTCATYLASRSLPREEAINEGAVVWKFPWRPVILMVAFSFAYRLTLGLSDNVQTASELGRLMVALVVLCCFLAAFDRFDVGLLFKVCPALVVAGLLLCLFDADGVKEASGFLVSAGYSGFTLYVYMTLNTASFRFGAPSEWLFGLTRASCILIDLPCPTLSEQLIAWQEGNPNVVPVTISCVVVLLVLLSMLLMTDRTPVTTWGLKAVRIGNDEVGVPKQLVDTVGYLEDNVYRCALVARHYGLTHREEEVLSLLARGSTLTEIREELTIAHGTLRAHVQHIYAKMGVHSYEEAREIVRSWK